MSGGFDFGNYSECTIQTRVGIMNDLIWRMYRNQLILVAITKANIECATASISIDRCHQLFINMPNMLSRGVDKALETAHVGRPRSDRSLEPERRCGTNLLSAEIGSRLLVDTFLPAGERVIDLDETM